MLGYYHNPQNITSFDKTGTEFEHSFIVLLKQQFRNSKTFKITELSGTVQDTEQGTDFLCGEIRIDPTTNFSHKNNMPYIAETQIPATPTQNFQIGIRHGNNYGGHYTPFEHPVVVIGLNITPPEYYKYQDYIDSNIAKHAENLMIAASDALDDYTTTDLKEREELFTTPLRPNPTYKQPRDISIRYKRIEQLRQKFDFTGESNDTSYSIDMEQ